MDLDDVADELYGLPPAEFTAARTAKVAAARRGGDRQLATAIGELRRPTASAAIVNQLTRKRQHLIDDLLDLAAPLRQAQAARAGDELRRLSTRRKQVVASLVEEGRRLSADQGHPPTGQLERELTSSLQAALADPDAADAVRSGRLTSAVQYSGFGSAVGAGAADPRPEHAQHRVQRARRRTRPAAPEVERARGEEKAAAAAALAAARSRLDDAEVAASRTQEAVSSMQATQQEAADEITELQGRLAQARGDERQAASALRGLVKDRDRAVRAARAVRRKVEMAQQALDR